MSDKNNLILSDSFEEMKSELGQNLNKMMEFVIPIIQSEQEVSLIATSIKSSGKLLLMHGQPGIGKSTFIQSLKWRAHIPIREIINIDASSLKPEMSKLPQLYKAIKDKCKQIDVKPNKTGVVLFVIDYLESLEDETPALKKSFFRDLNGMLRSTPIMIIWPVTEKDDIKDIINYTSAVSGTLSYRDKEVIYFQGPPKDKFPSILKNTISALNPGYTFNDYQLVESDFDDLLTKLINDNEEFTLRDYIYEIRKLWFERTGKINEILESIPKPTEVWFIFCMPESEQLVSGFVRKSKIIEDCWDAHHSKLDEYIHDNQRSAFWNSQRLQLAISGCFKTKILYMPTNALVSAIAAYGNDFDVDKKIDWSKTGIPNNWMQGSTARKFLENTPLVKQIKRESATLGATRGVANEAIEKARNAFIEINAVASKFNLQRDGSDKPFNKTIAKALGTVIPNTKIDAEVTHPFLTNIRPDIVIQENDKTICIEFCYTKQEVPSTVANYVLNKMDKYMRQLEGLYPELLK